ncbi:MAG TPA: CvpA family protein [Lacipirellulaceae bacterium]|nr:CvpA family protein [Lacipirellulaceae bacterium]
MQTYDMLMLAVLVAATLFGFWKGMAWQLASLASLVVSYFVSLKFGEQLAPLFGQQAPWNKFVAMFAIYVGTSFVVWMLFRLVSDVIDKVKLESFDRQLGGIFGFAKGVLLCVGITFFAVTLWPAEGEAIVGSQSGHYIVALLDKAHSVFPPEVHQVVDPYLNKIEQKLNPNYQPHGQDMQPQWPAQGQAGTTPATPQANWPQPQQASQQTNWPAPSQPAWPAQTQQQPTNGGAYNGPPEPNPFPGPYSAEAPASRPY